MVSMYIIYMIPIIVNLLTCGMFDSNQPKSNFTCCHQGGCSTVVLPYFVRPQVKATLNAPNGGIPNFIPTGWCEFKCRAICYAMTSHEKQTSLSVERQASSHRKNSNDQRRNKSGLASISENSLFVHLTSSSSRTRRTLARPSGQTSLGLLRLASFGFSQAYSSFWGTYGY